MKTLSQKIIVYILCIAMTALPFSVLPIFKVNAAESVVVVIDPGHGGNNLGTEYLPIPEKTYNMIVAQYMKEQLEQY